MNDDFIIIFKASCKSIESRFHRYVFLTKRGYFEAFIHFILSCRSEYMDIGYVHFSSTLSYRIYCDNGRKFISDGCFLIFKVRNS
jgi:hypothetical protein